jgi:hypothetical protein
MLESELARLSPRSALAVIRDQAQTAIDNLGKAQPKTSFGFGYLHPAQREQLIIAFGDFAVVCRWVGKETKP